MNKQIIRFAVSASAVGFATVPALIMQATLPSCIGGSTSDGGSPSGSSSSSGGGSSSGSDSGSGGGPCLTPDSGPVPSSCVIDDFSSPTVVSGGYWYTYSDRTFPNTTAVVDGSASVGTVIIATSDGMITPVEGDQFPPDPNTTDGPMVPGLGMPAPFRRFAGSGLTLWGAGMGFNWTNIIPADAGMSDAADAAPVLGLPGKFDASAHKGIAFFGKSNVAAAQTVGIHFSDHRVAVAAGECDASVLVNSPVECGDDFFQNKTFGPTWTNFVVKFADMTLKPQDYTGMHLKPGSLDTTQLYQVHFQVNNALYKGGPATMPGAPFDISVSYVTWYDGP